MLFLVAIDIVSSATITATTITVIVLLVVCKDIHILIDTASGHAMTDEVIEQVVQLQFELVVVIRLIVTTAFNFVKGCVPALQLSLK